MQQFSFTLEDTIFALHDALENGTWRADSYSDFYVCDPKRRHIHKATVRDRVLNQAIYRVLYRLFDPTFIFDSYSCRVNRGVHRGVLRLESFIRKASRNHSCSAYALKCDVRKFFDSISHEVLLMVIAHTITDERSLMLIRRVVESFETAPGRGLPLGNVTSQLFANVYLNELDHYIKHQLSVRYYLRYCDDFIIVGRDRELLLQLTSHIQTFLNNSLGLSLHPQKILLRKVSQGIDFLGYVVLPHYRVVRTRTKRRMIKKIKEAITLRGRDEMSKEHVTGMLSAYHGILSHAKGYSVAHTIAKMTGIDRNIHNML